MSLSDLGAALFWLTPFFPLGAAVLLGIGLVRVARAAAPLAVATVAASLLTSGLGLLAAAGGTRARVSVPWLTSGGRPLTLALWLEPLSALVAFVVALIGLVVFVYAASYMRGDPHIRRFFAELSLFVGAMLALVLAADLLTLFLAWEIVGLCSYLLIGFWYTREGAPGAATKAFLTTRTADLCLLAGILLLIAAAGTGQIDGVLTAATRGTVDTRLLTLSAVLVVAGAAGKSAQVPFQGWLPDAMLGPTPVSALLHSATMVAAGVFLLARLYPLLAMVPLALDVVAWIGVATALLGATAALAETDLKRLLAYSTMSQIGLMFVGLGSGSLVAGILLLVAQAFYKCALFLGAGALDHAVGGTSLERMGGLGRRMPLTLLGFAVAAAALAGLPVTLSLPAKDPALAAAWETRAALFWIALAASLCTALYAARAVGVVFFGTATAPAREAREAREPARGLLWPLLALAALLPIVLLLDTPLLGSPLERLLGASTPEAPVVTALALLVAAVGVLAGLAARLAWPRRVVWPVVSPVAAGLRAEWGLRPLYRALAAGGRQVAFAAGALDRAIFDRLGDGAATLVRTLSRGGGLFDRAIFDRAATWLATGVLALVAAGGAFDLRRVDAAVRGGARALLAASQRLRRVQTGMVGNYLFAIVAWSLGVLVVALLALASR